MYSDQYLSVRYAFLKPATHYQTVAQTRHWTELGGWRSKVGWSFKEWTSYTKYLPNPDIRPSREKEEGRLMLVRTSLIKCGDSEH